MKMLFDKKDKNSRKRDSVSLILKEKEINEYFNIQYFNLQYLKNSIEEKLEKLNNELLKYKDRPDYLNIVEEMNQAIVKGFAEGYRVSEGYVNNQELAHKEQIIAYKKNIFHQKKWKKIYCVAYRIRKGKERQR